MWTYDYHVGLTIDTIARCHQSTPMRTIFAGQLLFVDLCLLCGLLTPFGGIISPQQCKLFLPASYHMWTYAYYVDYLAPLGVSLVHYNADYLCGLVTICGLMPTMWTIDRHHREVSLVHCNSDYFCRLITVCGLMPIMYTINTIRRCHQSTAMQFCRLGSICAYMWNIDTSGTCQQSASMQIVHTTQTLVRTN